MKLNIAFIGIISLILMASCSIETAKPSKNKELVIASDYLEAKDTILFQSFAHKNSIRISIYNLSADKIIGTIRNKEANSGIDVIMLKSLYDISRLDKRDILQSIDFTNKISHSAIKYSSWKYNYVGFGIDPYIIAFDLKSDNKVSMYNDLTNHNYISNLDDNQYPPLLAPVFKKLNKVKGNQWIKDFLDHSVANPIPGDTVLNDTLYRRLPVLTILSEFKSNKKLNPLYKNRSFLLPNERSNGTFYNLRSIAIVDQASNYTSAIDFIFFCIEEENNTKINQKLNTYSIYPSQSNFRKYNTSSEELFPYYSMTERIKSKLTKD
jgi:ABC-type Fe3+ transport system substrate-binding protein